MGVKGCGSRVTAGKGVRRLLCATLRPGRSRGRETGVPSPSWGSGCWSSTTTPSCASCSPTISPPRGSRSLPPAVRIRGRAGPLGGARPGDPGRHAPRRLRLRHPPGDPRPLADPGRHAHRPGGRGRPDRRVGDGADDYVPKPFNPRELVARIRAVERRAEPPGSAPGQAEAPPPIVVGTSSSIRPGGR